jgi:hypothetical protein
MLIPRLQIENAFKLKSEKLEITSEGLRKICFHRVEEWLPLNILAMSLTLLSLTKNAQNEVIQAADEHWYHRLVYKP